MKIIINSFQMLLFNLWDAFMLAVVLGVLFRVFGWIVPVLDWQRIREDKRAVLAIIILLIILYELPAVLRKLPGGGF